MTVLAAMQSAAVKVQGRRPDTFFGAAQANTLELEFTDLVNEVAQDILKSHDWQAITRINVITGDGETKAFPMPDDYDRMLVQSNVQDPRNWLWGYAHFSDLNAFMIVEAQGFVPLPGGWTIYGNEMRFTPAPTGQAQFPYISKNIVRDNTTTLLKTAFTADSDEFLLPERLLTLGLVWRWRENKKIDFTGDQEAFAKAFDEYAAKDKGSRAYRRGGYRMIPGTYPAWPWPLGG